MTVGYMTWRIDTGSGRQRVEISVSGGELTIDGTDVVTVELICAPGYEMACLGRGAMDQFLTACRDTITAMDAGEDSGAHRVRAYDGDAEPIVLRLRAKDDRAALDVDDRTGVILTLDALCAVHNACVAALAMLSQPKGPAQ